jgi:hypothetical protein
MKPVFIALDSADGADVFVNIANITYMDSSVDNFDEAGDETVIHMAGNDDSVVVKGKPDKIMQWIEETMNEDQP